jgi:hypothetical protein
VVNFSLQLLHRQVSESSAAAALDWEVAVVVVDGAGVVVLELELSAPDWTAVGLTSEGCAGADMVMLNRRSLTDLPRPEIGRA